MTLSWLRRRAWAYWRNEQGQTMAEYGVILAVITVGIVAAVTALSGGVQTALNNVVTLL
jgi:Flp pilus assembly pilin Flp